MVFNALQIDSTFLAKSATEKSSFGQRRVASAECELSVDHITITLASGDVWMRACNAWLPQGPSYSMSAVVLIGKQRLYKPSGCHPILTSPEPCDNGKTTTSGSVYRAKSVNGELDGNGRP